MTNWLYKKVVFAGTFDHLHEGHKYLLRTAMKLGESVGIGLTSDKLLAHKKNRDKIQSFNERRQALIAFFEEENASGRCQIFPIDTKEGGADKMENLEALIISDEISVVNNAFAINELRAENGLTRFHILIIPRVRTEDGRPLSSSRLREGESFERRKFIR